MAVAWRVLGWIVLALAAAGGATALLASAARRRVVRKAAADLHGQALLLAAGARASAGAGRGALGVLMLFASGLYFRSWVGSREFFVAGAAISWIGVPERRGPGPRPGRTRIVVRFLNASGKEDAVTLQLLSPGQWVQAIKAHLIARA